MRAVHNSTDSGDVSDIADRLATFLTKGIGGSNFGTMCERASAVSVGSVHCETCGGLGFRERTPEQLEAAKRRLAEATTESKRAAVRERLSKDSICDDCEGTGYVDAARSDMEAMDTMFTTVRCSRCRGSAEVFNEDLEDVCQHCFEHGDGGYVIPVTVRETGSSKSGRAPTVSRGGEESDAAPKATHVWLDEEMVEEYGRQSRLLGEIRKVDDIAAAALELYYGPEGDRMADTRYGRIFVLWQLTRAGRMLIEAAANRSLAAHSLQLNATALLVEECEAEARNRASGIWDLRSPLVRQADIGARKLLERAQKALAKAVRE